MTDTTRNSGTQPQASNVGSRDGATPAMEPSVTEKPLANGAEMPDLDPEPQTGSAQDSDADQKLHLPLVLTLAGAAFLNASFSSREHRKKN